MPKRKAVKKLKNVNGEFSGYEFQEDDIANQMAYLFAGEKGEEAAASLLVEAQKKFPITTPNDLNIKARKQFIEQEVKKKASDVDRSLHEGLKNIFNNQIKDPTKACSGEDAGKEAVVNLLQGLGLNVDKDNIQTNYDPGPPQVFIITITFRPTANLANENSSVNQLANHYKDHCGLQEEQKKNFGTTWAQHVDNAKNGGPKIEKDKFMADADQSFKETLEEIKKPAQDAGDEAGIEMQNR